MITIFSKVAGKLARWEVAGEDYLEAIDTVKETGSTTGPVLALFERPQVGSQTEDMAA